MGQHNPLEFFGAFNWLFDIAMPCLRTKAFRILVVVYRQTWGRTDERSPSGHKMDAVISYSQFMRKMGASRRTVHDGIRACMEAGLLRRRRVGTHRGKPVYAYEVAYAYEVVIIQPWRCPWPRYADRTRWIDVTVRDVLRDGAPQPPPSTANEWGKADTQMACPSDHPDLVSG